jgi:hypothetical protein
VSLLPSRNNKVREIFETEVKYAESLEQVIEVSIKSFSFSFSFSVVVVVVVSVVVRNSVITQNDLINSNFLETE